MRRREPQREEGGSPLNHREPGMIFKVIFQGCCFRNFFEICFEVLQGLTCILNKKDFWVRTFRLWEESAPPPIQKGLKKISKTKTLKNGFENPSGLLPIQWAPSFFPLWLLPSPASLANFVHFKSNNKFVPQCTSHLPAHLSVSLSPIPALSAISPCSQQFSELPKLLRARIIL